MRELVSTRSRGDHGRQKSNVLPNPAPGGGGGIPMPGIIPGIPRGMPESAPRPAGGGAAATPRPADRATPWPPLAPAEGFLSACGGGASTCSDTTFSPRRRTSPRLLFWSFSTVWPEALRCFTRRHSSQSASTRFMCLSNARKVPTSVRPSWIATRILKLMY